MNILMFILGFVSAYVFAIVCAGIAVYMKNKKIAKDITNMFNSGKDNE